jgi:hypothetical protein
MTAPRRRLPPLRAERAESFAQALRVLIPRRGLNMKGSGQVTISEIKGPANGFLRTNSVIELGGPHWETAISALLIAALSFALLGWMLWPR